MKRKKFGLIKGIITFLLLVTLIALFYMLYLNISEINAVSIPFIQNPTPNPNQSSYSGYLQFYSNMRFPSTRISYNIQDSCPKAKKTRMLEAFSRLENETNLLKFSESSEPEIFITCQETQEEIPGKYFIAGEGGPTEIINASAFYIIEQGKVLLLYAKTDCNNYNIALHELLHVFGFEHSTNKESIMYNLTLCNQIITNDITNELKRLYSIPELPDLIFSSVTALKHGSYLDFNVEIKNQGLAESENASIDVYTKNSVEEKIDQFGLGSINYGEGKYLEVKNIKIDRNTKSLKFVLIDGKEINQGNNIAELFLPD